MFTIKFGNLEFRITINSIFILLYFAYCSITSFQFQVDAKGNWLVLLFVLLYVSYYTFVKRYLRQQSVIYFVILSLIVGIMYSFFTDHVNTPYPVISYLLIFSKMMMPLAIFLVLYRKADRYEMNFVFIGTTIILVFLIYQTLLNASVNKDIIHQMTNMSYENFENAVVSLSMDQSYALIPVACLLYSIVSVKKNAFIRIPLLVGVAIIIWTMIVAQFTSAVLILLICLGIYNLKSSKGIWKYITVFALILLLFFSPSLLLSLANNVDSENMAARLTEVAIFLRTGDASGYNMNARLTLYGRGIVAFLKSPFWGNYHLGFNPHSSFIQFAADIGVIGLATFVYCLKYARKQIAVFHEQDSIVFLVSYCSIIFTGMINPVHTFPTMFFVVFCYVPIAWMLLNENGRLEDGRNEWLED